MTKDFQVCGLGNAIVDLFVELPDAAFAATGFELALPSSVPETPPPTREELAALRRLDPGGSLR